MTSTRAKWIGGVVVPLVVIAVSVLGFQALVISRPEAERKPRAKRGVAVEVQEARLGEHPVTVEAKGTVNAAQQVELRAEVSGRVVWQSPQLVPGGRFDKGEVIVRIDSRDYALAVEQQQAALEQARTELQLERGRKEVAEREWELFSEPARDAGSPLALREPQMKRAKLALEAAASGLEQSKLRLQRTAIRAPFAGFIQQEQVDLGQTVTPQTPLATLVGTDAFWIQVSLPLDDLSWLRIPGVNAEDGSTAEVIQSVGGKEVVRRGKLVRLLGDLDPVGRMARVLVEIEDPYRTADGGAGGIPLLVGAFVRVRLEGERLERSIEVPRTALRDGDQVYLAKDSKLVSREVEVMRRGPDSVLVVSGLDEGDLMITSALPTAVEGMEVRIVEGPGPQAEPQATAQAERTDER